MDRYSPPASAFRSSDPYALHDVWACLQSVIVSAGNISKAFWGQGGKLAAERQQLRESCQVDEDSALRQIAIRNDFEHFDERLDRWWAESPTHSYMDGDIGSRIHGMTEIDVFRQYDPTTGTLHFWGNTIDLIALEEEIRRLYPIVEEAVNTFEYPRG